MIRLNDDYVIDADNISYMLLQDMHSDYTDKNGVTRHNYKNIGYYSSLYKALEGAKDLFARKCIADNDMPLGEACRMLSDINKQFADMYIDKSKR